MNLYIAFVYILQKILIYNLEHLQNTINLKEGTLLDGTVRKIFPYGAQIRIGDSNRR